MLTLRRHHPNVISCHLHTTSATPTGALALNKDAELLLYQHKCDTIITAVTGNTATAAPINTSTTPIAASATNLSNSTVRKGDDSGSMLSK